MNKDRRAKAAEYLYLGFFMCLLFAKGVGLYDGQKLFTLFLIPAALMWTAKMIITRWRPVELCVALLLLVCALISWRNSGDISAVAGVAVIIGMKDVSLGRLWRNALAVWIVAFFGAMALSLVGLWPTVLRMHHKGGIGFVLRDSLGMTHPNVLFISYIVLISLIFLVFRWRGRDVIRPVIWTCVGGAFIFMYAYSYTGLMCLAAFVVFMLYFSFRTERSRIEDILLMCVVPFCMLFSLVVPLIISGRVYDFFYKVFNTRFYMTATYLHDYPPQPFGRYFFLGQTWSVDCSYTYGLLAYGIILFALLMGGTCCLVYRLIRSHMDVELSIVLSLCIAGIMEPFMFNFSFKNLIWPILGAWMYAVLAHRTLVPDEEDEAVAGALARLHDCDSGVRAGGEMSGNSDYDWDLPLPVRIISRISYLIRHHKRAVICAFLAGVIVGGVISVFTVSYKPYIIINRAWSDYVTDKDGYEIYGEVSSDIKDNARIIGIEDMGEDPETVKCYVFEGRPIELITYRSRITFALAAGLLAVILCGVIIYLRELRAVKDRAPSLDRVTLCAISSVHIYETVRAMCYSMRGVSYADAVLMSDRKPWYLPRSIRFVQIDRLGNVDEYSRFCVYEMYKYIDTEYALIVHHDGFVVNPASWSDDYLQYDYIGSPWPLDKAEDHFRDSHGDIVRVGNGVSLRSQALMRYPAEHDIPWEKADGESYNEDNFICCKCRNMMEDDGIRFAPLDVAARFGREHIIPENADIEPFLFHQWRGINTRYPAFMNIADRIRRITHR